MFSVGIDKLNTVSESLRKQFSVVSHINDNLGTVKKSLKSMSEYEKLVCRIEEMEDELRKICMEYAGYSRALEEIAEMYRTADKKIFDRLESKITVKASNTTQVVELANIKSILNDIW